MTKFIGAGVALITPFKNEEVDYEALRALIEWHIQNSTDAIIDLPEQLVNLPR